MKLDLLRKSLGVLVALVIFFFLGRKLFLSWHELEAYSWNFHILWLFASFVTLLLYRTLLVNPWIASLRFFDAQLSYRTGYQIFHLSQLGRYLPGKVWLLFGTVYLCKVAGVGQSEALLITLLQLGFLTLSGILISGIVFLFTPTVSLPFTVNIPIGLSAIFIGLCILTICWKKIFRFVSKQIFKDNFGQPFSGFHFLRFVVIYLLLWCCVGFAFFLFVRSLHPCDWSQLPAMTGIYACGWTVGFLSFITPGGLGVREGMLTLALSAILPPPVATLIALLSRIWNIIADLILASIALGMRRHQQHRKDL